MIRHNGRIKRLEEYTEREASLSTKPRRSKSPIQEHGAEQSIAYGFIDNTDTYRGDIMAKKIHFEDDIFYINVRIRALEDMGTVDVDPDLFLEHTIDELDFLEKILQNLQQLLINNEKFFERDEQLENLVETEQRFSLLLTQLQNTSHGMGAALAPVGEKISDLRARSRERRMMVQGVIDTVGDRVDDPLMVSPMEINELLKGME